MPVVSIAQVRSIHEHFSNLILPAAEKKTNERGYMGAATFEFLVRGFDVNDDGVVAALFRSWDRNRDGHIDFIEVRALWTGAIHCSSISDGMLLMRGPTSGDATCTDSWWKN